MVEAAGLSARRRKDDGDMIDAGAVLRRKVSSYDRYCLLSK